MEHHIVEEVEVARVGVVVALVAVHGGTVVHGVSPVVVRACGGVAVVGKHVGLEDSAPVNERNSVAPHVGYAGGAVVYGCGACQGCRVRDVDNDVAMSDKDISTTTSRINNNIFSLLSIFS